MTKKLTCCDETFLTASKYQLHVKNIHQRQVQINTANSSSKLVHTLFAINLNLPLVFIDRVNGVFSCHCGIFSHVNPGSFRRHFINCQVNVQKERSNNSILNENELELDESIYNEEFFNTNDMDNNLIVAENNLIETELLKRYNLFVNLKFNLLICKTCKYVVEKDSVFNHVSRNHRSIVDSRNLQPELKLIFDLEINGKWPLLNSIENIETEEPIEGLSLFDGFQCMANDCNYLCRNKRTILKHSKEVHERVKNFEKCYIQTLFQQPEKLKYFKVIPRPNDSNNELILGQELNDEIFGIRQSGNRNNELGHQFVSSFETESNWAIIDCQFSDLKIQEIISIEIPEGLMNVVNMIYNKGESHSKKCNHHFVEKLNNPFSKYII